MKNHKTVIALFAVMSLGSGTFFTQNAPAAEAKGGKEHAPMSGKGRANGNSQWSADPEKGWVPTDEPRKRREEGSENSQPNREKHKDKRASKKGQS